MPTYYTLDGYSMLIKHHKLCLNIIFAGTILENPLKGLKSVFFGHNHWNDYLFYKILNEYNIGSWIIYDPYKYSILK